jgi:hypothetical protein
MNRGVVGVILIFIVLMSIIAMFIVYVLPTLQEVENEVKKDINDIIKDTDIYVSPVSVSVPVPVPVPVSVPVPGMPVTAGNSATIMNKAISDKLEMEKAIYDKNREEALAKAISDKNREEALAKAISDKNREGALAKAIYDKNREEALAKAISDKNREEALAKAKLEQDEALAKAKVEQDAKIAATMAAIAKARADQAAAIAKARADQDAAIAKAHADQAAAIKRAQEAAIAKRSADIAKAKAEHEKIERGFIHYGDIIRLQTLYDNEYLSMCGDSGSCGLNLTTRPHPDRNISDSYRNFQLIGPANSDGSRISSSGSVQIKAVDTQYNPKTGFLAPCGLTGIPGCGENVTLRPDNISDANIRWWKISGLNGPTIKNGDNIQLQSMSGHNNRLLSVCGSSPEGAACATNVTLREDNDYGTRTWKIYRI